MYEAHGATNGATKAPVDEDLIAVERRAGMLARARRAVLSDDRLAKQAATGDIDAFETIFSRYRDDLYRFCVGILREPQDAQDAVQNTMIKAMRALPGERRQMQLKPWLYRIAHNEAVELRRREKLVEELPATVDDIGALTDERAEENGRLRTLLADIADLPERQRSSLVLREVNGLGFGEIGSVLGTSPGAVRQALYEARRALSEMDHGRDMHCDAATRMVSDADGRPRDRGVRAHLRDCSPCRRFQAEIKERGRTFAAISPLPAIAAAGALKAALGGSGAAAGGSGAATVTGGAGAGGIAAGSIGASVFLKPAAGVLAVLAVGTAAVDQGGSLVGGRHGTPATDHVRSAPLLARSADRNVSAEDHSLARHAGEPSPGTRTGHLIASSPATPPTPYVAANAPPDIEGRVSLSAIAPRHRSAADERGDLGIEDAPVPSITSGKGAQSGGDVQPGQAKEEVETILEPTAATESNAPSGGATESPSHVPPGQAKKETVPPAGAADSSTAVTGSPPTPDVPPGQAKKGAVPPGQVKKEIESTSGAATTNSPAAEAPPPEASAHVPPGRAKKDLEDVPAPESGESPTAPVEATEAAKVPPGQAKKEEAATE